MIVVDKERAAKQPNLSVENVPAIPIKCPARNCKYKFELETIQHVMQKREFDISLQRAIKAAGIMIGKSPKKTKPSVYQCAVCNSHVEGSEGVELECHDMFCKTCVANYLEVCFTEGKGIHAITCPGVGCKSSIDVHVIKELIGKDKLEILEQRAIRQKNKVFDCPNCGTAFIIPPDIKSRILVCVICGESICRLCKQSQHDGTCKYRLKVFDVLSNVLVIYRHEQNRTESDALSLLFADEFQR